MPTAAGGRRLALPLLLHRARHKVEVRKVGGGTLVCCGQDMERLKVAGRVASGRTGR